MATLREVIIKGASLPMVWHNLAAMLALGLAFNMLAARLMQKAQDKN